MTKLRRCLQYDVPLMLDVRGTLEQSVRKHQDNVKEKYGHSSVETTCFVSFEESFRIAGRDPSWVGFRSERLSRSPVAVRDPNLTVV